MMSNERRCSTAVMGANPVMRWLALALGITFGVGAVANDNSILGTTQHAAAERVLADHLASDEPGCSVAAMRKGIVVHASARGLAVLDTRRPLATDTVFNVASLSKQFTAFSILLLEDREALSLDDPLIKYIPELAASARGVTLRHLIHHMGGLRDYMALLTLRGRRVSDGATQFETIQMLARQRGANFPPGTQYEYSNSGYVLLATVVERVSGRSLQQFAAENIFGPLGMTRTTIVDRYPAELPRLARGYSPGANGYEVYESAWEQVGDGQVHTTTTDLLLWAENMRTGRVGSQQLMQRMTEPGVLQSGRKIEYAAGLVVGEHNGLPTVGHSGHWAGYASQLLIFPQQHFALAVLCNRSDAGSSLGVHELAIALADVHLAEEMRATGKKSIERESAEVSAPKARWQPARLADYAGVYWSDEAQARCVLVERGRHLYIEGCLPGYLLQLADNQQFYSKDATARLQMQGRTGDPSGFTLQMPGLAGLSFTRQRLATDRLRP